MLQAWRWFGVKDPVSLDDIRQAGAEHIVCALYETSIGDVWQTADILALKNHIEQDNKGKTPLAWSVVESIPVHDDIKRGAEGWQKYADNFIASCQNLAECGIHVVAYNFMPLLDWTRTDLNYPTPNGAQCLRFDYIHYAAFDCFILARENAKADYDDAVYAQAQSHYQSLSQSQKQALEQTILAGLPGGMTGQSNLAQFKRDLSLYRDIDHARLQENLINFLRYVTPACQACGVTLALHPDDPPFSLFGLPRVVSTHQDLHHIITSVPSIANQLTFCTGSLGVRADNDLVAMAQDFAPHIAFAHLRGTRRDDVIPKSFQEAEHLDSDVDTVGVIRALLNHKRQSSQNSDKGIFFRPDHGWQMLDDLHKQCNPGYSAIGRLKGLAELRGVMHALIR